MPGLVPNVLTWILQFLRTTFVMSWILYPVSLNPVAGKILAKTLLPLHHLTPG